MIVVSRPAPPLQPPQPAAAVEEVRRIGRSGGCFFREKRLPIGLDRGKTAPYCPPRLKAMGLVDTSAPLDAGGSTDATTGVELSSGLLPTNRSRKRFRFSAPLGPGPFRGPL